MIKKKKWNVEYDIMDFDYKKNKWKPVQSEQFFLNSKKKITKSQAKKSAILELAGFFRKGDYSIKLKEMI